MTVVSASWLRAKEPSSKRPSSMGLMGLVAILGLVTLPACDDDASKTKPKEDAASKDAGAAAPAGMDPKLAAAVQSAAVTETPGADEGPPPNGVFAEGGADEAHAPGAPVAISVIDAGSEPRQRLKPQLDLSKGGKLKVKVSRAIPGGQLPPVLFGLSVKTGETEDEAAPRPITFEVKSVELGQLPQGQQPVADIKKMLDTLKGTKIETSLSPRGELGEEKLVVGEGVKQPIDQFAVGLNDVIGLFFSPMPDEPVGVGASWIAHDRTQFAGMKVVRYRVTKLEKKAGDDMALSVDLRMYAIDQSQKPDIAQGEAQLMAFQATGKGSYTLSGGSLLPTSGQLEVPVVAQLASPKQPNRAIPLQFQTRAEIVPTEVEEAAAE